MYGKNNPISVNFIIINDIVLLKLYYDDKVSFLLSGSSDRLVHMNNIEVSELTIWYKP